MLTSKKVMVKISSFKAFSFYVKIKSFQNLSKKKLYVFFRKFLLHAKFICTFFKLGFPTPKYFPSPWFCNIPVGCIHLMAHDLDDTRWYLVFVPQSVIFRHFQFGIDGRCKWILKTELEFYRKSLLLVYL